MHKVRKGDWHHNRDTIGQHLLRPAKEETKDVSRELNEWIVRKWYPLTKIQNMLQELEGFSCVIALDLSIGILPYSLR